MLKPTFKRQLLMYFESRILIKSDFIIFLYIYLLFSIKPLKMQYKQELEMICYKFMTHLN